MPTPEFHPIVIAGGGLSGLAAAWRLRGAGHEPLVLEARRHVGGRIQSFVSASGAYLGDRGPSWVWPDYQPIVRHWLDELQVIGYPQFTDGQSILDLGPGQAPRVGYLPAQMGSERLVRGPRALVDALQARLPAGSIRMGHALTGVVSDGNGLTLEVTRDGGRHLYLRAAHLVVALPPRVAIASIDWQGGLSSELVRLLQATPTWMASHAKAVMVFKHAFWREAGLSGRIASQAGPLGEVHDHCGPGGKGPAALFGFFSWPVDVRRKHAGEIEAAIREQLGRAFGDTAPSPIEVLVEDWATNRHVATEADLTGPMQHPVVGPAVLRGPHLDSRDWFAGAECAARSPGLIEGALDAAEHVAQAVSSTAVTRADGGAGM